MASEAMISARTAPGPTEGSWSTSPTSRSPAWSGNFYFLNLLTMFLCLFLLDDRALASVLPARFAAARMHDYPPEVGRLATATATALAAVLVTVNLAVMWQRIEQRPLPGALDALVTTTSRLGVTNFYGFFGVMNTVRHEIVVEGSRDGEHWRTYEFRYKPGDVPRCPNWSIPYHPRLDWTMWFAASESPYRNPWFGDLLYRLLQGAPPVLALLADNPFPGEPPKWVRATLYQYRFTTPAERAATGDCWVRKRLGPYPPYIKDIIDSGRNEGIVWSHYQPKLVFAGEVFSEEWRELVCERIGATDPAISTASLYGTADGGVLGNETPLSIRIRKFFAARPDLARDVFGESRLPTLVQYDPLSRYFEVHDGTLVVSGDNGVPLVRYHIADKGGIISCAEMTRIVADAGGDQGAAILHNEERGAWELPFAYLFGRADFTVSYFGANVYPENISVGLEQAEVRDWVSGKFVLQVVETTDRNEALSLVVELLPGIGADKAKSDAIADAVIIQLRRLNSEFANYVPAEYQRLLITLKSHADPEWFPVGVKHRYTRKR